MAWPFRCASPDFTARSIPDDVTFGVKRQCLVDGSELFGNMFADCADQDPVMDLPETADALAILFRLLHDPPAAFEPVKDTPARTAGPGAPDAPPDLRGAIPLPVIPRALALADKYMLSAGTVSALRSHVTAHAATEPLRVYALALTLGLNDVASTASEYLLHPPLAALRAADVAALPDARALHALVRLHAPRAGELRAVLAGEALFPHDYGLCYAHGAATAAKWDERKRMLAPRIQAGTDVAAEMAGMKDEVTQCKICTKAVGAAVDMLAYKCRKVIRKTGQLPPEE